MTDTGQRRQHRMIPPRGFEAEMYPLYHKIQYSTQLSMVDEIANSTYLTLIRHYKAANNPDLIEVNPHNPNYNEETGSIVNNMSLIKNFKLHLKFNMTENVDSVDKLRLIKFMWRPVFFTFPEKLDATDDDTGATVISILALLKDATQEDITPLFDNNKLSVVGTSDMPQPMSTTNLTETFGIMNMDTGLNMENVDWDENLFQNAKRRYTNKGALKACVGRARYATLTTNKPFINYTIDGAPRALTRIMPYSFMAILVHVPILNEFGAVFGATTITSGVGHLGLQALCTYEEWHQDHYQKMEGTGA